MSAHSCQELNPNCYRCDLSIDEATAPAHDCNADEFDRVLCGDPCNTMHAYCSVCGECAEECVWDLA